MRNKGYNKEQHGRKSEKQRLNQLRQHLFLSEPILKFLNADEEFRSTRLGARQIACGWQSLLEEIKRLPSQSIIGVEIIGPVVFEMWQVYDQETGEPTLKAAQSLRQGLKETLTALLQKPDGTYLPHVHAVYREVGQRRFQAGTVVPFIAKSRNGVPVITFQPTGVDTGLWAILLDFVSDSFWRKILQQCPYCKSFHTRKRKSGHVATLYCSEKCSANARRQRLREKKRKTKTAKKRRQPSPVT